MNMRPPITALVLLAALRLASPVPGALTLSGPVLGLDQPAGADAIPGDLIVGTKGGGVVRLQEAAQAALKPGAPFDYSRLAFQPESWEKRGLSLQLIPWTGTNVIFLTTKDDLDAGLMARWVSRLDAGWHLYAELTGRKPNPFRQFGGKVTIAAVPGYDLTCGAGCGYVGATGIELAMFYDHNYPELRTHPEAMPH
jgi:hypothetical protein